MCLVLCVILSDSATLMHASLSSNTLHATLEPGRATVSTYLDILLISRRMGIEARNADDNPMFSASVVDMATVVCICDFHMTGQFAYMKVYPWRDSADAGSLDD